jgi:N-6 DNA Methylase
LTAHIFLRKLRAMPTDATFESFEKELNRLVDLFGKRLAELKKPGYAEAQLRDDFLNPMFRALGWDMENRACLIQREREVEIESATQIGGGRKRADYLFRADKRDRFVCEAKKPAEELHSSYAFQAKRYAWNKGVPVAVLTDFEELKIYIVGGKPQIDEPEVGEWKSYHFQQYPLIARELWDLLARDKIAAGSIDAALDALPKKATVTGKARQKWLIKPDRNRALDNDFLEFLDETRRDLASDIYKNNDHDELLDGHKLTEACQRVIDRILFLRICEDRDIDTGERLQSIVDKWRKNTGNEDTGRRAYQQPFELHDAPVNYHGDGMRAPKDSLWRDVVRHFRALDRRPPSHVPFFNGNLFKSHFTETLIIGDEWLARFIGDLSDDESPYLFNVIEVEILGSVYERFLGKVVRPQGRGITIEDKPEVRKAGGVYYTPRYIVDYIVEQTAGKLLNEIAAEKESEGVKAFSTRTEKLRLLDPACGSGSFLIRAFERVCEHWQKRLTAALPTKEQKVERAGWEKKHRPLCWVDAQTNDVHLTVALKRQILTQNIYGVDVDAAAVEVTQLSLYLKMLEDENRTTLQRQRELLSDETEIALLPPLQDNIKCGNSLIASDFSMIPEDLVRVHAFDWPVQFALIMRAGGFDAVIGNRPYIRIQGFPEDQITYFGNNYLAATGNYDIYVNFVERGLNLLSKTGRLGMILPNKFFRTDYGLGLRKTLSDKSVVAEIVDFGAEQVFDATTYTCLLFLSRSGNEKFAYAISKPDPKILATLSFAKRVNSSLTSKAWTFADEAQARLLKNCNPQVSVCWTCQRT